MEFAREPQWDLPVEAAFRLQRALATAVSLVDRVTEPEVAAGVDLALGSRESNEGRGVVVVWRVSTGEVLEEVVARAPIRFPYVPGLLAFREGPLVEAALRQVRTEPDLLLFDGQGIAHPRGLGIAAHLGVLLDRPSIGIGKSRLTGYAEEPGPHPGNRSPLLLRDGRVIGTLLRTTARSKPVYVSPGNHVSPERAADLVMACVRGHRLPEPVHLADKLSKDRTR